MQRWIIVVLVSSLFFGNVVTIEDEQKIDDGSTIAPTLMNFLLNWSGSGYSSANSNLRLPYQDDGDGYCPRCSVMQEEISNLKTELKELKQNQQQHQQHNQQNFDKITAQIEEMKIQVSQISTVIVNVTSAVTQVKQQLDQLQSNAVTDIQLTYPQSVLIWRGPGYPDNFGWVITGIDNWNQDMYPDYVTRRLMQKKVNGNWVSVSG